MVTTKNNFLPNFLSVLMPVYNAEPYLESALKSILRQTYTDFEFIIVDDCSSDNSYKILQKYAKQDPRIRLFHNKTNLGVSQTILKAISHAKGQFLARMDGDDIASPQRFQKQIEYLRSHPSTVAIGTQCYIINEKGKVTGKKEFPTSFEDVYRYSFTFVPVQQPTLMMNRSRLPKRFEYYHDSMNTAEEVELFFKLFKYGKVENLPDFLLKYRLHTTNTSFKNLRETFLLTLISRMKAVYAYNYKPRPLDVLVNLAQFAIVSLLPESLVLWMYRKIRNIHREEHTYSIVLPFNPTQRIRHAIKW